MTTSLADQFEALATKATQGNWSRSGIRSKRLGEDCTVINCDDRAMLYSPIGRTHAELAASINEADFIAFCFNNRAAISSALTSAPPVQEGPLSDIAAERKRQIEVEGWTLLDDDTEHDSGQLARAAGCYALYAGGMTEMGCDDPGRSISDDDRWSMPQHWPWSCEWWKPKNPRRDLVRAAALIVAEIERLDRSTLPAVPEPTVTPEGEMG